MEGQVQVLKVRLDLSRTLCSLSPTSSWPSWKMELESDRALTGFLLVPYSRLHGKDNRQHMIPHTSQITNIRHCLPQPCLLNRIWSFTTMAGEKKASRKDF